MKLFLKRNLVVENYTSNTPTKRVDEIDDLSNAINDNLTKNVDIPKDVLDSFKLKDTLEPQIWTDGKLNPTVKNKLMKIANDFFNDLKLPQEIKLKDVIFTGSLANYNWSKFSDVDLHILLDFSKLEGGDQFKEDFFFAQKSLWNQNHDITIFDYPVEIYAQDLKAKLAATAVYSIKNDKWVLKPELEKFKINKKAIKNKAEQFIDKLKDIRQDYQDKDFQSVVDKVKSLKTKIKNYRTAGLDKGGEFSLENLVFKVLRRTPFMDILDSYKNKAYDTLMSVEEVVNENEERQLTTTLASTKGETFITIYRACKLDMQTFNDRDYVTLSKKFAIEHAENNHVYYDEPFHVIAAIVSTKELYHASNPDEYFYHGRPKKGRQIYVSKGPFDYEGIDEAINVLEEGNLIDDVEFKFTNDNMGTEYRIDAILEDEIIGSVLMDVIYDVEDYFADDFTEEEIEHMFQSNEIFLIEWLEVPDDYYKGAGVGRALMNKAIQTAKELEYSQIYLNASPIGTHGLNLTNLVKWYESFGFKTILNQGDNALMLMSIGVNTKESIMERLYAINEANSKTATKRDYYTTLFKVAKVKELYGGKQYWENVQDGQWIGAVIVNIHGQISKVSTYTAQAKDVRGNDLGMRGENPYYMEFKIMAGRGIEHPDTISPNISPARTRTGIGAEEFPHEFTFQLPQGVSLENGETKIKLGLPIPGSPASDAHIKTYLIYGDLILDFVKNNMKENLGYIDGKGAEYSEKAMANNPTLQRKKIKKDLEMELGRSITDTELQNFINTGEKPQPKQRTISMDNDKLSDFEKRQADAIARREKFLARRQK
jgi:GNAT superfamily N-acetyltransferase